MPTVDNILENCLNFAAQVLESMAIQLIMGTLMSITLELCLRHSRKPCSPFCLLSAFACTSLIRQ